MPNPQSQILNPGRLFQMFAMFPMFSMFPLFAMFAMFSRTPDARKKNRTARNVECGIRNAECRCGGPRVSKGLTSKATFPIWNLEFKQPAEAGTQNPERFRRFKRFTNFRHFISFIRFNRFRNVWPRRKMKHPTSKETASPARPAARVFARGWL